MSRAAGRTIKRSTRWRAANHETLRLPDLWLDGDYVSRRRGDAPVYDLRVGGGPSMSQSKPLSEWPACPDCATALPVEGHPSHLVDYRCLRCGRAFDAEEVDR
jgi:hypothetical protein